MDVLYNRRKNINVSFYNNSVLIFVSILNYLPQIRITRGGNEERACSSSFLISGLNPIKHFFTLKKIFNKRFNIQTNYFTEFAGAQKRLMNKHASTGCTLMRLQRRSKKMLPAMLQIQAEQLY